MMSIFTFLCVSFFLLRFKMSLCQLIIICYTGTGKNRKSC